MTYSKDDLDAIFARTDGRCHICWKGLARVNYGQIGKKGAWEVEHSVPRANGGTDHGNNLFPAHIRCNRSKGDGSSRAARAAHGRTRAPLSRAKQDKARAENVIAYTVIGGLGAALLAPELLVLGAIAGAIAGFGADVE